MADLEVLWNLIKTNDSRIVLILFVIGLLRQWWVMGWQYRDLQKSEAEWKDLAKRGAILVDRATTVATTTQRAGNNVA